MPKKKKRRTRNPIARIIRFIKTTVRPSGKIYSRKKDQPVDPYYRWRRESDNVPGGEFD
ncbi:MAG: hypothetical protein IH932_01315 [Thaumarchaeota archaeon]|nr:hypothetical protein [Nitrososphaerota archaeon]